MDQNKEKIDNIFQKAFNAQLAKNITSGEGSPGIRKKTNLVGESSNALDLFRPLGEFDKESDFDLENEL